MKPNQQKIQIDNPIIQIFEVVPGQYKATSAVNDETTANILMSLAINFFKQSERKKIIKEAGTRIINPSTGKQALNLDKMKN